MSPATQAAGPYDITAAPAGDARSSIEDMHAACEGVRDELQVCPAVAARNGSDIMRCWPPVCLHV